MDVLTSETCWALKNEIIKQVTSSLSLFIYLSRYVKGTGVIYSLLHSFYFKVSVYFFSSFSFLIPLSYPSYYFHNWYCHLNSFLLHSSHLFTTYKGRLLWVTTSSSPFFHLSPSLSLSLSPSLSLWRSISLIICPNYMNFAANIFI